MMFATDWGRCEGAQLAGFGDFDGIAPDGLDNWGSSVHSVVIAAPDDLYVLASVPDGAGVIVTRDETGNLTPL